MITTEWQRPARCPNANCLEARSNEHGGVELRSTTTGERITALATEWAAFVDAVKGGQYDLRGAP